MKFRIPVLAMLAMFPLRAQPAAEAPQPPPELHYALILTGSELLEGLYADTHTQFITRTLLPLGGRCVSAVLVGDDRDEMLASLRFARSRAELIIVTGGLGPTDADLTRELLAEFTGIPLAEEPALLSGLERRFGRPAPELTPGVRKQAKAPERGTWFENREGTAAGLVFEMDQGLVVALPGPPGELQSMVTNALLPYLTRRYGLHPPGTSTLFRFVGVGESAITQLLHEQVQVPAEVRISFQFDGGRVDLTLSLPGNSEADRGKMEKLRSAIDEHLGGFLYSHERTSLEEHVLGLLNSQGIRLAVVEVGSGGALTQALVEAAARPGPLAGTLVAPDHTTLAGLLHQPLSPPDRRLPPPQEAQAAAEAAELARNILGGTRGLAVMAPVEGEGGERFLWAAFGSGEAGFVQRRLLVRGTGRNSTNRLVTDLLDFLRRELRPK